MITFFLSFIVSAVIVLLLIRYQQTHQHISLDLDLNSVQKFHTIPVPRIGGVGVVIGFTFSLAINKLVFNNEYLTFLMLAVALPTFLIGLIEDMTKKVGVLHRLIVTALSAALGAYFLNIRLMQLDLLVFDTLLGFYWFSLMFTSFAVAGVANAFNLIDGFNGLAAGVATIILLALSYVAHQLADPEIMLTSLSLAGAVLGFALWNYPRGLIFLGDGGAYFIGFMVAEQSVWLLERHPQVSPWFPLLLVYYPIFETLFTIFRRLIVNKVNVGMPDATHLHQLIYRRLIKTKKHLVSTPSQQVMQNSATSPYLWVMTIISVIPAILFYSNPLLLKISVLLYSGFYVLIYRSMYKKQVPR